MQMVRIMKFPLIQDFQLFCKKKGYKDQVSYVRSIAADTSLTQSIKESVATTYDFSNIASVSGKNTALESCLTSAYGFSVSNRSNMNETFKLSSENGADLNIYVLIVLMTISFGKLICLMIFLLTAILVMEP